MTKRKFYKTVFKLTVISETPVEDDDLESLNFDITYGDCSGSVERTSDVEINGAQAARELLAQASDPGFFMLTDKGEDVDE